MRAQSQFARAEAEIVSPTKGAYDTTGGLNLYIGSVLGADKNHEFSLSVGAMVWSESSVHGYRSNGNEGTTTIWLDHVAYDIPSNEEKITISDGKLKLQDGSSYNTNYHPALDAVPVLANYRCYFGDKDSRVRLFVGGGVGYANLRARSKIWQSNRHFHDDEESDSAWKFAWNATAGVSIKLTEPLRLDVGYAYQEINGTTFDMSNLSYKLDSVKTNMLRGGVTWLF